MIGAVSGAPALGLRFLATVTAAGVAAVDFTGLDPEKAHLLQYWDFKPDTGGETLHLRFSTDGGSSFLSSADYGNWFYDGALSTSNSATSVQLAAGVIANAAARIAGSCWIYPEAGQGRAAVTFANYQADTSGNYEGSFGSGISANPSGSDIDAIRLFASAGNISGEFRLYEVKS
jgi:hypothetical protein